MSQTWTTDKLQLINLIDDVREISFGERNPSELIDKLEKILQEVEQKNKDKGLLGKCIDALPSVALSEIIATLRVYFGF